MEPVEVEEAVGKKREVVVVAVVAVVVAANCKGQFDFLLHRTKHEELHLKMKVESQMMKMKKVEIGESVQQNFLDFEEEERKTEVE